MRHVGHDAMPTKDETRDAGCYQIPIIEYGHGLELFPSAMTTRRMASLRYQTRKSRIEMRVWMRVSEAGPGEGS